MTTDSKARCLLVGGGGVGTMAAYNLEAGGKATVTAVLRSNFTAVERDGFSIDSIDHGKIEGWRPTESMYSYIHAVHPFSPCLPYVPLFDYL